MEIRFATRAPLRKDAGGQVAKAHNVKFDLRQLKFAVLAADLGSIHQAADVLSVRQSTISRSIKQFEQSIGVTVFERSSAGVSTTATGRSVLRIARTILEEYDALVATAVSIRNGQAGDLAVGFCTSLSAGNLRASLLDFKQRLPQIRLATVERSRTRLARALRSGVVDLLIVTGSIPSLDSNTLSLWSERVLVVLPEDHPLATQDAIYWTDLRGETILISHYDPGRELEDLVVSKLVAQEDRPRIERHDVSRSIIKSLISMKIGISLVLESDIGANFSGVVYRELRDGKGPSRLCYSAYWRAENENPALEAFLKLLAERYPAPRARG